MSEPLAGSASRAGADPHARGRGAAWLVAVCGLYLLIACWNLSLQGIANPDEPRYAAAAREMLRSGDWVVPRFNGEPRIVKPLLFYWEIAAVGAVGQRCGLELSTAFRLGPILMGLLALIATFLLARRMLGARGGFLAACVLLTTVFFHSIAREIVIDMTLTAFIAWAWFFAYLALKKLARAESATGVLFGFYLCLGLICLTKGPAPVAGFVVLPLVAYLFWTRRLADLKRAGLVWGVPLALALGVSWSVMLALRGENWREFYGTENFARATGGKDHVDRIPFVFYLKCLVTDFEPWFGLLLIGAALAWKRVRGAAAASLKSQASSLFASDDSKLLAAIIGVSFCCIGIAFSKRPLYMLPLYPFLAIWAAWIWENSFLANEGRAAARVLTRTATALLLLLGCGCLAALPLMKKLAARSDALTPLPGEQMIVVALGVAFLVSAVLVWRYLPSGRRVEATLVLLAVAAAGHLAYEGVVRPMRERFLNRPEFYTQVAQVRGDRPVLVLGESANEAAWYLYRPSAPDERFDDARFTTLKTEFFDAPGTLLLVDESTLNDDLRSALRLFPVKLWRGKPFWLAEADPNHPPAPSAFEKKGKAQKKPWWSDYWGGEE